MSINYKLLLAGLSTIFFILKGTVSLAQRDISFRQLSVNDGLSQNSAVSVTQDQDGFLWIATQEGLNRYDGEEFIQYPKKFNDITQPTQLILGTVFADSKNRIWIIPDSAIPELLDKESNTFIPIEGVNAANQIFEDSEGSIWIGTLSGQLFKWNDELLLAELIWNDPTKEINHIADFNNQILLTFQDEIALFDPKSKTITTLIEGDEDSIFSVALPIRKDQILYGTLTSGLWVVSENKPIPESISSYLDLDSNLLESSMILDLWMDKNGAVWVASYGQGVFLIDLKEKQIQNFTYSKQNPRSIHYNDILCLFEDYTGTIWMGSDGAGLSFYDPFLEKFNFFHNQQLPENINIDVIRSIYVDQNGKIWAGTSGKGLTCYNPISQEWKTYQAASKSPNTIRSNRVMSLMGIDEQLWIGYQDGGLSILDQKTGIFTHYDESSTPALPSNTVWKILKDDQNRMWLCTRNDGLIQFDPKKGLVEQFIHDAGNPLSIPDNNIRTILQSGKNEFWIGTENHGIAKLNLITRTFERYQYENGNPNSLSNNSIKSLYLAPDEKLWIGTNGSGINILDLKTKKFDYITSEDGLSNDVIYGILPDDKGDLWLSSNKGITQIQISGSDYEITNYSNYDGLATEFNTGAYFRHPSGTLYFGSLEGLYWFDAEDISFNPIRPKTAITHLRAFDQDLPLVENLELRNNQSTLTFHIASLVFSSPEKNQFQYYLEGYDDSWINSGPLNVARYTNLPPGDYTFFARSSNYDGIWSEETVEFSFSILPPWYLTWIAKTVYVILLILGIWWIINYFKWKWKMQYELRLKEAESHRLHEIDQFKNNFFTNISHEFRTPLTLIMGTIQRLLQESENPVFKSQLNLLKQNSSRLLNLVDQLLEASKIKTGRLNLKIQKGNLGLLLQTVAMNFFYSASEKGMQLTTQIPLLSEIWFDADKVEKIIGNLLQNAIKYGKPNTEILLKAELNGNQVSFLVRNSSSRAYSEKEKAHLFDKFFKADQDSDGFGIGLPMIKDLVELHKGTIQLNLDKPEFFEVQIKLPVDKYSFSPEDVWEENIEDIPEQLSLNKKQVNEKSALILVVEDNDDLRKFLIDNLSAYFNVIDAKNGKEGLFLALKKVPDLIISDVMMPEMDGMELCHSVKMDEKTSHIPVILLTAKSEEENMLKGLREGADDYITKPFSIQKLLVRIEKLIELRRNLRIRYSGKPEISPSEIAVTSTDERFLQKVQEIVDSDLMDANFSVDEFSKKLGMSRMQLHRKLTALTGLSTSAFIRDQRLRKSLQRLEKTDETVAETAYSVGFSSPSYFIKCFKEIYQMTPAEYQQSSQKN
ncbi:MAG: response regulator [Algoriphagus sp.]|uniref:hybrid sensor histidine kinase/response regulator transcription factor n=1 Tax=Algoriphagus sp. TaxID=1872435 RepID=UPI0018497AE2|nr:hybrid sensor histidine kinase/response regulator transcription factor [Algoriphagus sp.]NVJ85646.1 response regulator [Algoriphagus sp.]